MFHLPYDIILITFLYAIHASCLERKLLASASLPSIYYPESQHLPKCSSSCNISESCVCMSQSAHLKSDLPAFVTIREAKLDRVISVLSLCDD